jgi:hypothetical protein
MRLLRGASETDFDGGTVRDISDVNNYLTAETALGRVGLPDDIGSVVAFYALMIQNGSTHSE